MKRLLTALALTTALPGLAFAATNPSQVGDTESSGSLTVTLNVADPNNQPTGIVISGLEDIPLNFDLGAQTANPPSYNLDFCVYMFGLASPTYSVSGTADHLTHVNDPTGVTPVSYNLAIIDIARSVPNGVGSVISQASQSFGPESGFTPSINLDDGCQTDGDTTRMAVEIANEPQDAGEFTAQINITVAPDA